MNRFARGVRVTLVISLIALAAVYLLLGYYYSDGFAYGTWINGIYCTGKSVEEVNELLKEGVELQTLTIEDESGATLDITPEDIGLTYDFTESLEVRMKNQNPLTWGIGLFNAYRGTIIPTIEFDIDSLYLKLSDWEIFKDESDLKVYMDFGEDGYYLVNEKDSVPDLDNIFSTACDAIYNEESSLVLAEYDNCYKQVELNSEQEKEVSFYEAIDLIQNPDLSLQVLDDVETIDSSIAWKFLCTENNIEELSAAKSTKAKPWLGMFICNGVEVTLPEDYVIYEGFVTDAEGYIYISEEKIHDYAESLLDKYDTGYTISKYLEDPSSQIMVTSESKGNKGIIDGTEIYGFIIDHYLGTGAYDSNVLNVPLRSDITVHEGSEIGDTFIVVDMGAQQLTYYVDGQINMQFPVVTGNTNRGRGTPSGVYNIYNKRHDTILRGENYASFVHFWLGVHKGVGIHDANWRDEFGGEIYKNDGSHGCINCPSDEAETLWNIAEVGTPTILFY